MNAAGPESPALAYILPIKRARIESNAELTEYLRWLDGRVELVVVDGSPHDVFTHHHALWEGMRHVRPTPELHSANGKAWGVNTGLRLVAADRVVIADDDVRYDADGLDRILALLEHHDVVRPQNYFDPLPWHARWDTGRILLNRALGGDWPGTLGVHRPLLLAAGGYDGGVLFENLELWRTVEAAGGRTRTAPDLYVRRLPPTAGHFWSQRIRQAYDEFARPARLFVQLAIAPIVLGLLLTRRIAALGALALLVAGVAEVGRRRAGGTRYFPASTSLFAPVWLLERACCSWLALVSRLRHGGVPYSGGVLSQAATPRSVLRERLAAMRSGATGAPAPSPARYEDPARISSSTGNR